jgi:type I restriction enzyme S subunit
VKTLEFDKFFKTKTSKSYQIETKDYLESATYPVVDQGQKFIVAYSDNEDKLYRIEEPVIIFGDHTRIIKYIDFDFIIGADGTKILLPFDDTIDAKYAYYQLLFTKIESLGYSRHFKVLKEKIFYKPSLTKQKEIAQTLDKASELIALRKATIEKLDELSQSIFIDMFGDSIENPMKWNSVKFGKMISVLTDYHANGSYKVLKKHVELLDQKNYALMVRTTDLEKNNFEDGVKYITKEAYDFLNKTKVFGNELIMNKIGSAGNIYLMPKLNVPVSLGMNQFLIRLNESCNSIFVFKLLKSEYGKKNIEKQVRGAVTKSITKDAVRDIDLLLPPLNLQNQFAQTIEKIESQKSLYEAELTKLQEGFDALMAQSFEG